MKRRRVPRYVLLPLVVAVALLVVVKLLAMQRADIIADLAHRIAHHDTPEATSAVRQLAAMSRPPVTILVTAATSGDREVAEEAKQAIHKMLRRCERQIANGQRLKAASRQLTELAESLTTHCQEFSHTDRDWLSGTAAKILSLANQMPSQHCPLVASQCDAILAAMDARPASPIQQASHAPSVVGARNDDAASESATVVEGDADVPTPDTEHEPLDSSWRANWSNPVFRMSPATPFDKAPIQPPAMTPELSSPVEDQPTEIRELHDIDAIATPLAALDSRTLLERWVADEGRNALRLEQELAKRGFNQLSRGFVQPFLSSRPGERLRFMDIVLAKPGVDARAWLLLLAEDRDADVRLAAVTIMATSNDTALVEKAYQAAIHDRDPRIAGLAERLRERRAATQRR
jgi:hypothetical protein